MAMRDYSISNARNIRNRDGGGGGEVSYSHQLISVNGQILKLENSSESEATYYVIGADNHVNYGK